MPVLEYLVVATALVLMPWLAARLLADGPDLPDPRATFEAARARHTRRVLTAALLRHGDVGLPVLAGTTGPSRTVGRVVPLREVVGSVDRGRHPFDRCFDPTDDTAWARFAGVLEARNAGLELPPVLLHQGRDGYYVVDGHHRVAVARALGDTEIRAEVAVDPSLGA